MSEDNKIPLVREAEAISKLSKPPVPVSVAIYELAEDMESLIKKEEVGAFLHRLTWLERNYIRGANTQVYKHWIDNEGDPEKAKIAIANMVPRITVYFALKISESKDSKRFFESQEIIMEYPYQEGIQELYKRYLDEFSLSETEWGNFLRARNLGTSSVSPAISQVQTHSVQLLEN